MPVYVEIAGRAYPLRFTLRGALRLLDLTGQTPMELLAPGLRNTVLLLYAALCDGCPHVTLSQAAALCAAAARERDALSRLLSALALALAESGLDQTRLDRELERGMAVSIGRLRPDTQYDYKFVCLSHNTLRGAAGGAVLLAELLCAEEYITRR
mgnify:CR=1 FL=1